MAAVVEDIERAYLQVHGLQPESKILVAPRGIGHHERQGGHEHEENAPVQVLADAPGKGKNGIRNSVWLHVFIGYL